MEDSQALDFLIVGAGPSGLSAALEIKRAGLSHFLVLEKGPSHSQMIRKFYKEGKRVDARYAGQEALCFGILCLRDGNRESYLSFMDHVIEENKIPTRYNVEVFSVEKNPETSLFKVKVSTGEIYESKVVIVAIGKMGKPHVPDYWKEIPSSLKTNKSLLFEINSRPLEGLKILVVGGGDSACEYAQLLAEKNKVTLSYRRPEIHRANEVNLRIISEFLSQNKIRAYLPSQIIKIEDDVGRPKVYFQEEKWGVETFDVILYGLGGMTPLDFLKNAGLKLDESGEPLVSEIKESSISNFFVVGDLLGKKSGGGSIISGFNSASTAVRAALKRNFSIYMKEDVVSLDHLRF